MFSIYFHYFTIISPWQRMWLFIWKNWIPFTNECFVPSLVGVSCEVLQKIFICCQCIFAFCYHLPWKTFQQPWMSFTQGCYMASLVEIGSVVLEKMKMYKVYRLKDGWTTYSGQQIRWAHLSLDELNTELCLWINTVLMFNGWSLVLCDHFWMMYLYPFEGWCQLFVIFHKVHHKEENGQSQTEHPP